MRNLTELEVHNISGGMNCIDYDMWQKISNRAKTDGALATLFVAGLSGAITWRLTNYNPIYGVAAATAIAPYAWLFGYNGSGAWNILAPTLPANP